MKWITRERVKVDRVACPWLIRKFVDKDPEFIFVPGDKVMDEAKRLDAIPYDVPNVELGHHGKECSFEAIVKKYKLDGNSALMLLGRIVNGADTDNTLYRQAEGPGLNAVAEGFRHLGYADDHALNAAEWIVYDGEGQLHTASLVDYLVPSACEIPPIDVVHLETLSPTTLGGFRGMGEGGTIGAPAAVANAIADALAPLGIEINELPVTPERLFRLITARMQRD